MHVCHKLKCRRAALELQDEKLIAMSFGSPKEEATLRHYRGQEHHVDEHGGFLLRLGLCIFSETDPLDFLNLCDDQKWDDLRLAREMLAEHWVAKSEPPALSVRGGRWTRLLNDSTLTLIFTVGRRSSAGVLRQVQARSDGYLQRASLWGASVLLAHHVLVAQNGLLLCVVGELGLCCRVLLGRRGYAGVRASSRSRRLRRRRIRGSEAAAQSHAYSPPALPLTEGGCGPSRQIYDIVVASLRTQDIGMSLNSCSRY
jgi:hypothetical protein